MPNVKRSRYVGSYRKYDIRLNEKYSGEQVIQITSSFSDPIEIRYPTTRMVQEAIDKDIASRENFAAVSKQFEREIAELNRRRGDADPSAIDPPSS